MSVFALLLFLLLSALDLARSLSAGEVSGLGQEFFGDWLLLPALATDNIPTMEVQALQELYNATNGDSWNWQSTGAHWDFSDHSANPCAENWQGITCTTIPMDGYLHVHNITLNRYDMVGALPSSISVLSQLAILDLAGNFINGAIPSSLGQLAVLSVLNLNDNYVNGTLPVSLGDATNLTFVSFAHNLITGTIPDELCTLPLLSELRLYRNQLVGGIPTALCNAALLTTLSLADNTLHGTIPNCLQQLELLKVLILENTYLTGTLPQWLGMPATPNLTVLALNINHLHGPLPVGLQRLISLTRLEISYNSITGTIPSALSNLSSLQVLRMHNNNLHGRIPQSLFTMPSLEALYVNDNQLSGTIPANIGNLGVLKQLSLGGNNLRGIIPHSLGLLTEATVVDLSGSGLSGTLPPSVYNMSQLRIFDAHTNYLSSTVPACFLAMRYLSDLVLYDNAFTGPLPPALSSAGISTAAPASAAATAPPLTSLLLYDNQLTGPIPDSYSSLTRLNALDLHNNRLTGSIPSWIPNISPLLREVDLSVNYFHGPLNGLDFSHNLTSLQLGSNVLTGSVPPVLGSLPVLHTLLLSDNKLTGALDGVFGANAQLQLLAVIVNNNQLTGTLPVSLFAAAPAMTTFVASTNCLHGTLPAELCNQHSLQTLVLDGLTSSPACRNRLLPGLTSTYTIQNSVHGTVPACLFSLPLLETLQLSGNRLTGALPDDVTIGEDLGDLSLSHNALSGTIPANFQNKPWLSLDLSYNKITGTLLNTFFSAPVEIPFQVLNIDNNRISGVIPEYVQHLANVSMLGTNVFSCKLNGGDLPEHDSNRNKYSCGSDAFNVPYYVWLGMLCVTIVAVIMVVHVTYSSSVVVRCRRWCEELNTHVSADSNNAHLREVLSSFENICKISVLCAVYSVLVLLPVYVGLSYSNGTLTHEFAWTVSAAFLSGTGPVIAELLLWLLLTCVVVLLYHYCASELGGKSPQQDTNSALIWQKEALIYVMYLTVNTVVVVAANVAYVYIAIYKGGGLLVLAQILLALFKFGWGSIVMDKLLSYIVTYAHSDKSDAVSVHSTYTSLCVAATILNNVIVPCLVVSVISPRCFYNVFSPAEDVQALYIYYTCSQYVHASCEEYSPITASSSYSPPYEYSYQCSSSLITYYAPAFVNLCIVSTFVAPLVQVTTLFLYQHASSDTKWQKLLAVLLPVILKPLDSTSGTATSHITYFKANRVFLNLITYLALLLTFGVVFPPLGVALAIAVVAVAAFAKLKLGRFLCAARLVQQLEHYVAEVERECEAVHTSSLLHNSLWMLVTLSCWFYTPFLFDTLGDAVGFGSAYWVLIVVPLLPLCLYFIRAAYTSRCHNMDKDVGGTKLHDAAVNAMHDDQL